MHIVIVTHTPKPSASPQDAPAARISVVDSLAGIGEWQADAVFDLAFTNEADRVRQLQSLQAIVFVNAVPFPVGDMGATGFIRINGWPTFFERTIAECAGDVSLRSAAENVLLAMGKSVQWVPDTVGMVTPRIVAMIINEAYLAFEENVSSKQDIDTAMKMGTNYPYGPFEWAEKIGKENIVALLTALSMDNKKYLPAPALLKEVHS